MTELTPADLIPPPLLGAGEFARGYDAGVAAIRILAPGITVEQMLAHIRERVIPEAREATAYERGVSRAFGSWGLRWTHRRTDMHRNLDRLHETTDTRRRIAATVPPFTDPDHYPEP
jgi:hypothetical protein